VIGVVIQGQSASTAARLQPFVKKVTGLDTVVMLALVLVMYGKGFLGAIGTWAILAQVLFFQLGPVQHHLADRAHAQAQRLQHLAVRQVP